MKTLSAVAVFAVCLVGLSLNAYGDYSGGEGSSTDPFKISRPADWVELMGSSEDWGSSFVLTENISLSGVAQTPVGTEAHPFTGTFDGCGFTISFVGIEMTTTDNVGLFGYASGGEIKNVSLTHVSVAGQYQAGGLCGWNSSQISNCSVIGTVSGAGNVGGLVGYNLGAVLRNCFAAGTVYGNSGSFGGLCGYINCGAFVNCYAVNSVSGEYHVGGLCGYSYRSSAVNCYSAGAVSGTSYIGGMFGWVDFAGTTSSMSQCFWDTQVSGRSQGVGSGDIDGVTGKSTAEMQTQFTFTNAGWDFTDSDGDAADWQMPAESCPRLGWETLIAFSPKGGTYPAKQSVTVTCSVPEAVLHYTTNGRIPTESDPVIASGTDILISKSLHLYVSAWRNGSMAGLDSATYVIDRVCPDGDLNGDCKVDMEDFAILSLWWLEVCNITNQWCDGADLDASGQVDLSELEDVVTDNLQEEEVAGHIKDITVQTFRVYNDFFVREYYGKTVTYQISIDIGTDAAVTAIEFTTPAGNTFSIPATGHTWRESHPDGLFTYGKSTITPDWILWEYDYDFYDESSLAAYGDGLYTFTVHYVDGSSQQTTAWFGIPDTADPIPTPTQIPTFSSFDDGDVVSSPVTFAWQACTDPAVTGLMLGIYQIDYWAFQDPTLTSLADPVSLPEGERDLWLVFTAYYGYDNEDGIGISTGKHNHRYYKITVDPSGGVE